ncbi:MAG: efflux RND transporter periplasmic adaptor subunit [Dehalococcoidales bacterium]|nr:efflux RND transporter periplasmic adaptor subunit [Dehalococcoidales bacterium]
MKVFKILLSITILGAVLGGLFGCSAPSDEETPGNQIASVIRGDLLLDITAAGNLALSLTEDLAVDLFYGQSGTAGTKGTIGEVLVEEGDTVTEGQVLVTVDADEWQEQLSALEDWVTTKERALVQAQINLKTAEQNLKNAQDNMAAKELAVLNVQISLDQAVSNLAAGIPAVDYQGALGELRKAQTWYTYVMTGLLQSGALGADDFLLTMEQAEERLTVAQTAYDNILSGYDSREIAIKKKQIESAELSLANAEEDLADVTQDVSLKELSLTLTQGNLQDAEKALEDAREDVADAQSKSPEIVAPFDGFVTLVNVAGGDEVLTGTVTVQLADPDKFEADILVSEMDILQVKLGGDATVQADALPGIILPARVTHISPTATIQSGVVNYAVRVELESLESMAQEQQEMKQQMMTNIAEGELPPFLQMAVDEGRMTQEEAEELLEQGPPEGFAPPEGFEMPEGMEFPGASGSQAQSQLPAMVMTDLQLREGLTVTVSIIVAERTDVLLVPNAAVIQEGLQGYVEVVINEEESEKRAVQTGISDWQYTEIIDGLTEGEQVIVQLNTGMFSSEEERGGMMFFGRPR